MSKSCSTKNAKCPTNDAIALKAACEHTRVAARAFGFFILIHIFEGPAAFSTLSTQKVRVEGVRNLSFQQFTSVNPG